jgi:protocatechuate 3,4-dioxygenase beta subunit
MASPQACRSKHAVADARVEYKGGVYRMSNSQSTTRILRLAALRPRRPSPGPSILLTVAIGLLAPAVDSHAQATDSRTKEPIISLPCEGCEAVFQGLPDTLKSAARIAPKGQPGEPMRIEGTVYDQTGQVAPGVIVYAYHTDAQGIYPPNDRFDGQAAYRHGLLRGWAVTDERGNYRFETIRPASYPDSDIPAHVHMHLIEPGCCTYYIPSIRFADDPRLSADDLKRLREAQGGRALARPKKNENGVWIIRRDIVLGEGVSGYPEAGQNP